jgi:ech hydrogenase subunit B
MNDFFHSQSFHQILAVAVALVAAPIIGGLIAGLDRKLTARLQGRLGPPVLQPFYDLVKLLSKEPTTSNRLQRAFIWGHLAMTMTSLALLVLLDDVLALTLIMGFASVCLILAGFAVRSPYSYFGAQRELMVLLSCEPILLLCAVAYFQHTGSFLAINALTVETPLLTALPLVFVGLIVALAMKTRKSPFDVSTSHHAHQELVKGVTTEISGRYLAMVEIAHWYEVVILLGLMVLFWPRPLWVGVLLALCAYLVVIVLDNATARLTWRWMVRVSWSVAVSAIVLNMVGLYVVKH